MPGSNLPVAVAVCATFILALAANCSAEASPAMTSDQQATAIARQEIEYLRRLYGHATDLIGSDTEEAVAEGRAIYHRIFTPDARITVTVDGETQHGATGPDGWVDVVRNALSRFRATQHLIGSQVVDIESLPDGDDPERGRATMASHLQAWHDGRDGTLDIFIGTYRDRVRHVPGKGWQIEHMDLERVSGEIRTPQAP